MEQEQRTQWEALVNEAERLFSGEPRPDHFTDYRHCEECADHDALLTRYTLATIDYDALGNPGWDPVCFVTDDGFRYYFPAMVRLALWGGG